MIWLKEFRCQIVSYWARYEYILKLMCDAINEKDERYKYASELMDKDGCK